MAGQIDLRVRAHEACFLAASIAQLHFDFIHLIDNVIIRDDVPFIGDNHTGAERVLHERFVIRAAKASLVPKIKLKGIERALSTDGNLLRRFHSYDRRHDRIDEGAAFAIESLQRRDILGINTGRCGKRVLLRGSPRK